MTYHFRSTVAMPYKSRIAVSARNEHCSYALLADFNILLSLLYLP